MVGDRLGSGCRDSINDLIPSREELKKELRTSNVQSRLGVIEREKMNKQTYDPAESLLEY
jgi:hypothetical protein